MNRAAPALRPLSSDATRATTRSLAFIPSYFEFLAVIETGATPLLIGSGQLSFIHSNAVNCSYPHRSHMEKYKWTFPH